MQWWCSAQGTAWTWEWRAYPGVWLLVLAVGLAYYYLTRNPPPIEAGQGGSDIIAARTRQRRHIQFGWGGVVVIWLALDWPIGPLAAGYLASIHALQFMMLALIAAPLVLLGIQAGASHRIPTTGVSGRVIRFFSAPLIAVVLFNVITIGTHASHIVDSLMVSQLGAFATDLAWFLGAIWFWWPVIVQVPARPRFTGLFQILYLFLGTIFHTVIAIIMLMSQSPLYGVYELAPPMTGLTALQDLHIAGGIMELIGAAIIFPIMSAIFFRWAKASEEDPGPPRPVSDPRLHRSTTDDHSVATPTS